MNDILFSPIRLSDLETLIKNAVSQALEAQGKDRLSNPTSPTEEPDRWLDINQLSEYLPDRPKTETIYERARNGEIPAHKKGKKWYFLTSEINQYLKTGRKKTKAERMEELRADAEKKLELMRNKAQKEKPTHTYVMIDNHTGFYKIGKSNNVAFRENTLMSQKPSINLIFYIKENVESNLHRFFLSKRVRGEWFSLADSDLDFIKLNYKTFTS